MKRIRAWLYRRRLGMKLKKRIAYQREGDGPAV